MLVLRSQEFLKVMLKRSHKVSSKFWGFFSKWKKAPLFLVYFLRAFLLKPPCVLAVEDWAVCMGKCTSAVSLPNQIEFWCRACVFLRSKKRGISSLCNWRLERGVEAQRLGDYGKMSLSCTFSSLISHFAILFYYITQFSLNMFPECSKTKVESFLLLFFSNYWVYKMLHCMLLFHYKNPALYNLRKHNNRSAALDASLLHIFCIFSQRQMQDGLSLCVWVSCRPLIDGLASNCQSVS